MNGYEERALLARTGEQDARGPKNHAAPTAPRGVKIHNSSLLIHNFQDRRRELNDKIGNI
jgi:hypothetical protein